MKVRRTEISSGDEIVSKAAGDVNKKTRAKADYEWLIHLLVRNREYELAQKLSRCRALVRRVARGGYDVGEWVCRAACCPACMKDKAFRAGEKMTRITKGILAESPNAQFLVATFSLTPCDASGVSFAVDVASGAFGDMVRHRKGGYREKHVKEFQKALLGYCRVVEVALSPATLKVRVHVHCVFAVRADYCAGGGYMVGREKMKWVWRDCVVVASGGEFLPAVNSNRIEDAVSAPVGAFGDLVHISLFNGVSGDCGARTEIIADKIGGYISYGLKGQWLPAVKQIAEYDADAAAQMLKDILTALKGRNLISSGGCFKPKKMAAIV